MNANSSAETGRMFIQGIIILLGLIGLYYLYQYLFGVSGVSEFVLINKKTDANVTSGTGQTAIDPSRLPPIYDGGEFSFSTWIYVQNWGYRSGFNKHIMSIGGSSFDTIRVYLGGQQPKLHVRLHTKSLGDATSKGEDLATSNREELFTKQTMGANTLDSTSVCDLPEIDLQRWIQLTVAVNGRTVDVYMDGKLARSCVLPEYYKVDGGGYSATLLGYGGFGGFLQGAKMYNAALPPDVIYKIYMAGPEVAANLLEYLQSFFEPRVDKADK